MLFFSGTIPSTLTGTFGDLGFLSPVAAASIPTLGRDSGCIHALHKPACIHKVLREADSDGEPDTRSVGGADIVPSMKNFQHLSALTSYKVVQASPLPFFFFFLLLLLPSSSSSLQSQGKGREQRRGKRVPKPPSQKENGLLEGSGLS